MKKSSRKAPRGLLTIESLQPRTRVKDPEQKPREFVPLGGLLYAPLQGLEQHDARDVKTAQ